MNILSTSYCGESTLKYFTMVPSQCPVLMYYVFEFLWLLAEHSCEVTSNSRLWKAQTEPLHLEEWKPNVPHVKILNFCWQCTGTTDKEGHCVYAGVCDGFNLTSWSAFPPCQAQMWLSGSSRLSVTHLDLSHFLSALSGSLEIVASRLRTLVYHKITSMFLPCSYRGALIKFLLIKKFYSGRNEQYTTIQKFGGRNIFF